MDTRGMEGLAAQLFRSSMGVGKSAHNGPPPRTVPDCLLRPLRVRFRQQCAPAFASGESQ